MKPQLSEWENVIASYFCDRGLPYKIYKESKIFDPEKNDSTSKTGQMK